MIEFLFDYGLFLAIQVLMGGNIPNNQVDLVLFAGDAYKSRDPSQTHQKEFAKRIARLSQANIPVFLLLGNHDLPHIASRATALDIFHTLSVPNVTIGDRLDTYVIQTLSGPLQIISLPTATKNYNSA